MNILSMISSNKYLKNIATLSFGSIVSQLLIIGASPIVTRLYSPEEMGEYSIFLTIIMLLVPIINGRYDMLLVTIRDVDEVKILSVASMYVGIILSFITGLGLLLIHEQSNVIKGTYFSIYLCGFIILINSIGNVLNSYNNRQGYYKLMANVSVVRSVTQVLTQIGFVKLGSLGLLISQLISSFAGIRKQLKHSIDVIESLKKVKYADILMVLKKYSSQPLFSVPATLMNSLSYSLITFLIDNLYSLKEVGFYSLSLRILGLPITLISSNISRVFFAKASEEKQSYGHFYNVFKKTALLLTVLTIPIFTFIMIFSEWSFEFLFGPGWGKAGLFASILSPMFAIRFVTSTLSVSIIVGSKQKFELFLQSIFLFEAVFIFIIVKQWKLDIDIFLILISVFFFLTYLIWFFYMLSISKEKTN